MFFTSKLKFPCYVGICLLIDIIAAGLIGWQLVQAVLCLYLIQVLSCATELRLIFVGLVVMLESFIAHGALFAPLVYLVPVLLLGAYARHMLYPGIFQRLLLAGIVFLTQCLVVEYWLLGLCCPVRYILYRLCVNLVVIIIL